MGLLNKQFEFIKSAGLALSVASLLAFASGSAIADGPCIAAGKFDELKADFSCANEPSNCQSCKNVVTDQKKKSGKKFDKIAKSCATAASGCNVPSKATDAAPFKFAPFSALLVRPVLFRVTWISRVACEKAYAAGVGTQKGSSSGAKDALNKTAQCESAAAKANRDAAKIADDCASAIKAACSGVQGGEAAEGVCKKISTEANQIAAADDAKAAEAQKTADKNDENAKKEGGMPQIPQIPQIPQQQQEQQQQSNPNVNTGTDASITSATAATPVEAVKLDSGATGASAVGFGENTATNTSTTTSQGYPSYGSPGASAAAPYQAGSSALAPTSGSGGGGSYSGGGGGSAGTGGGGALQNTSGASAPGGGEKPASDSPYEVSGGGGGKLGAPKGFKSGEGGDGAIADIAKDNFKADIAGGDVGGAGAGDAKAGDDESESGYSVFKMVKARYVELKKRGSI
jgi:hypothetical protein